ncbi:hypothetical protein IQ255_08030 [Pleurocapsales cyanobacterium LEGE 10410]|nr:hypothetical protein [Pleurocapsales cyanobacterium LEGE 10410]
MTHFGILSLAATGHLNTMFPLGCELKRRGHNVTFLSNLEAKNSAHTAGFDFCEVYSPSDQGKTIQKSPLAILEKGDRFKNISRTLQTLIYASMGTLQNRRDYVFQTIAEACADLDAQLIISLGGGLDPKALPKLSGDPLVVKYAPQLELLQQASLNITHGGLNTTLESLSYGVPMVAIPVTDDQPGVAARIVWTGVGELISLSSLSVSNMRETIKKVLGEPSYKKNAVRLQQAIERTEGVKGAVNIIEQAVSTKKPVINLD